MRRKFKAIVLLIGKCINNTTIKFKNCLDERSMYPNAYKFYKWVIDRVCGNDCSTHKVYEGAAKEVVLSVLNGINSSVFAYGQKKQWEDIHYEWDNTLCFN